MANKYRAQKINRENIIKAMKDGKNKYTFVTMASELGITDRHLRHAINKLGKLQPDHIVKIAELTGVPVSSLTEEEITLSFSEDTYDSKGRLIAEKGTVISFPKIGSNNYTKDDLYEWNKAINGCLVTLKIGEKLHNMEKNERADFVSWMEGWIMLGNKYYGAFNIEQSDMLFDTIEAIADTLISKNKK